MSDIRDFSEFRKLQEKRKEDRDRELNIQKLQNFIKAVVAVEHLTPNEDWNEFLAYITPALEHANRAITDHTRALLHPMMVEQETIMMHKIALAKVQGIQEALNWVLGLPKTITEVGAVARQLYEEEKEVASG